MKRFAGAALVASAIAASASTVRADAPSPPKKTVRVLKPECMVHLVDLAPFATVLRVELDASGFSLVDGAVSDADMTLVLETSPCDPDATSVDVVVEAPASGQRKHRLVPVWDLDATARPRAVALASAELVVRAAWRDPDAPVQGAPVDGSLPPPEASAAPAEHHLSTVVSPVSEPNGAPSKSPTSATTAVRDAPPQAQSSPRTGAPRMTFGAAFEYRNYPANSTPMLGGRVLSRFAISRGWELGVDGGVAVGSADDALGTVTITAGSAGVSLMRVVAAGDILVLTGPALEAGYAYAKGTPSPDTAAFTVGSGEGAPLAAAMADVGLRIPCLSDFWLTLDALGGFSASALRGNADDRTVVGTAGGVWLLRAGVAESRNNFAPQPFRSEFAGVTVYPPTVTVTASSGATVTSPVVAR